MTIICVKDGVIAVDSGEFSGTTITRKDVEKLATSEDGAHGAACGESSLCHAFRDWFRTTLFADRQNHFNIPGVAPDTDWAKFSCVWLEPDGEAWIAGADGVAYPTGRIVAHGAVSDLALGALRAGASAAGAVRICIDNSTGAAGEVRTLVCGAALDDGPEEGDTGASGETTEPAVVVSGRFDNHDQNEWAGSAREIVKHVVDLRGMRKAQGL